MCDYKDGDIVWVKLGPSCWWPGEVHHLKNLPPEWLAVFKKPPLAAVKFFDRNSYEYVRSIDKICYYNCTKKNEFIKKGLDLHRTKNAFMEKFPADVTTAERKTDGDPNIIDNPMFNPEKETNFAAISFGAHKVHKRSPRPRKSSGSSRKSATGSSRNQSTSGSSKLSTTVAVTHPRFLGRDDHEIRILVQTPDKSELEKQEAESSYNCTSCSFTTTRIDVFVLHNKSHIQGVYSIPTSSVKTGKKTLVKRGKKVKMTLVKRGKKVKMTRSKTSSIVEDLDLIEKGMLLSTESSDDEAELEKEELEPKRKCKKNKRKPKKIVVKKDQETKADICDNLLAEWEDTETKEDNNLHASRTTVELHTSATKIEEVNQSDNTNNSTETSTKDADKSCFDFEKKEDEIIGTFIGRKIPRVIPPTDRQKSTDPGQDDADLSIAENYINRNEQIMDVNDVANKDEVLDVTDKSDQEKTSDSTVEEDTDKSESLNVTEKDTKKEETEEKSFTPDIDAFKEILEATAVPDLSEIPHSQKFEQNFHKAKTIKFFDKPSATDTVPDDKPNLSKPETKEVSEISSKLINPKQLFVKSFEDFHQQLNNEQKKLELEQLPEKAANVVEVSKLKTQLMSKLENSEKLFPKDSPPNKRTETSRQSRSPRNRILEKQREEKSNLDLMSSNKSHIVESLSPKTKLLDYTQPKSPHEAKPYEATDAQRLEENLVEIENPKDSGSTKLKSTRRFSYNDDKTDIIPHCKTLVHPETPKSRRLSVKMPEVKETKPLEVERTAELLELEQHTVVAEPANVLEEKDTIETLQVEQIVMEEAHIELQPAVKRYSNFTQDENESSVSNKSPLNLTKDENVFTEGTIESSIAELYKNQSKSEFQASSTENAKVINENTQAKYYKENLKNLTEALESDIRKDNELFELKKPPMTNNLETKQEAVVGVFKSTERDVKKKVNELLIGEIKKQVSELQAEIKKGVSELQAEIKKEVSELLQISSKRVEQEFSKNTDAVVANVQHYVHANISFSCTNSENNSPNFRIDNKDPEDLLALTALATVSELTTNFDIHGSSHNEKSKIIEDNLVSDHAVGIDTHSSNEKGNLMFVTGDDLADGQVEIVDVPTITKHKTKPITLTSFSVDFTDSNRTGNAVIPDSHVRSTDMPLASVASGPKKRKYSQDADRVEVSEKKVKTPEPETHFSTTINITNLELINVPKSELNSADVEDSNNCDIEDHIPSLVVCSSMQPELKKLAKPNYLEKIGHPEYTSSSKFLKIFADGKPRSMKNDSPQKSPNIFDVSMQSNRKIDSKPQPIITKDTITAKTISKFDPKNSKFVIKSTTPGKLNIVPITNKSNKPIILSEKNIKPVNESSESVSVQKVTSKRSNQDIDAFIIKKPAKKLMVCQDVDVNEAITNTTSNQSSKKPTTPRGKVKILQNIIIKPARDVIQPTPITSTVSQPPVDDNMFDSNSMPIVLGNQTFTAESIENMPVVLSDTPVQSTSTKSVSAAPTTTPNKSQAEQIKLLNKSTLVTTQPVLGEPYSLKKVWKYRRIYQTSSSTNVIKNNPAIIRRPGKANKFIIVPSGSSTSTGTKYSAGKKPPVTKRSSAVILPTTSSTAKVQNVNSQPTGNKMIVTNRQGQQSRVLLTHAYQKSIGYKTTGSKSVKSMLKGNILQKASNAKSTVVSSQARQEASTSKIILPLKRPYPKKSTATDLAQRSMAKPQMVLNTGLGFTSKKSEASVPQLAPISLKKFDAFVLSQAIPKTEELKIDSSSMSKDVPKLEVEQKPLDKLIIQDALGNPSTIIEGEILALPIDGQPQSYMLVTLDKSGNFVPVSIEELLSLDPNLVLQIDEGAVTAKRDTGDSAKTSDGNVNNSSLPSVPLSNDHIKKGVQQPDMEIPLLQEQVCEDKATTSENTASRDSTLLVETEMGETLQQNVEAMQTVTCSVGSDPNQQLIITGDPILASVEGNILIQTDEQQILFNTDAKNQVLLPMNAEGLGIMENSEGDGNPIFANQHSKNQDIFAAALADMDVFQQEQSASPAQSKIVQSQLSLNSGLYPTGFGNVLGTTLSLSSPIMTPLEVPSSNNKKIPDEESDILTTEVPKNVDLPITITDPNITQAVAQLIASELTGNLDLPLAIPDHGVPLTSAEMNSSSFVYSMPSLDESVDIHQKTFSGPISMPLLTEEPQESTTSDNVIGSN